MTYSGLYRCSGCSVTFSDPAAWRESPEPSATPSLVQQDASVDASRRQEDAPPTTTGTGVLAPQGHSMSTWGLVHPGVAIPGAFGYNEADVKAINEAAQRAGKSKHKGLRG